MLKIIQSKNGYLVPIKNNISIHSRYNPVEEGKKYADRFLNSEKKNNSLIVIGLGFGYHIFPLLENYEEIIIYENDEEFLEKMPLELKNKLTKCQIIRDLKLLNFTKKYDIYLIPVMEKFYPGIVEEITVLSQTNTNFKYSNLRIMLNYPIYGGSYTTSIYVKNALKQIGVNLSEMDNSIAEPLFEKIRNLENKEIGGNLSSLLIDILSSLFWEKYTEFKPHICLFMAQSPISTNILKKIKETGGISAFWFVEDYKRFDYWKEYAPIFDLFCTIQKDDFFAELSKINAKNILYLPMAASNSFSKEISLTSEELEFYGSDISFMGAGYPNRHSLLSKLTDFDLKIWGTDWNDNKTLLPFIQKEGKRVSIDETIKIYKSSKININLHSSMNFSPSIENGDFVNPRTFEILACGGFQLIDNRKYLPELFEDGKDLVVFHSEEDLREKIIYYLNHPEEREKIAKTGQSKVLTKYTYVNRMKTLLNLLIKKYPIISETIFTENARKNEVIQKISNPDFREFIKENDFSKIDDLDKMIKKISESETMSNSEAILRFIKTFED